MFTTEWDRVKLMGIGTEITGMWKECTETVETGKDEGKLLSSRAINQPQNSSTVACLLPRPDKKNSLLKLANTATTHCRLITTN